MILLALLGCLTYSGGQVTRGELNCELLEVCGRLDTVGYSDVDACQQAAGSQPYADSDCPDFDPAAMNACLGAWRDAVDAADCEAELSEVCQVCG